LCVIKRTVTDFYVEKKVVPACKKLLPVIREKKIPWEEQYLRRVLQKIGLPKQENRFGKETKYC
jgi:hypothetical protein